MTEKVPSSELYKLVQSFLEYLEVEKNKSKKTILNYHHYLTRFLDFTKEDGIKKAQDIDLQVVRKYRLYLNRLEDHGGKPLKLITQNYHVIALRAFLKFLAKQDVSTLAAEKIELAKNPSREVHFLEPEELERIFLATAKEKSEILRLRDQAILNTLFSSGVRISELVSLKTKQINLKTGEFSVRGKGDKLRVAFLSADATEAINKYLKKRTDNHPALFLSHTSIGAKKGLESEMSANSSSLTSHPLSLAAGLSARSVQRLIKKYSMLAGITKTVTPHTFRHSFATDLLQNGADIRSVQSMLGHASITTTQIYTHITNQGLREVHKKFHSKK